MNAPTKPTVFVVAFAGVGGQGALSAARFLGYAAYRARLPVTVSQLHGMSQRGGAVVSTVAFGSDRVLPPESRPVDLLVGLEFLEAIRALPRVGAGTTVLANTWMLPPPGASLAGARLPRREDAVAEFRRRAAAAYLFDATALAERAGGRAAVNVVLLGALSALPCCPVPADELRTTVRDSLRPEAWPLNHRAFLLGREAIDVRAG